MMAAVVLMALAIDGGVTDVPRGELLDVRTGVLTLADGGVVTVVGGAWADDSKLIALAKEQARLRAENEVLRTTPPAAPPAIAVAAVAGVVAGLVLALVPSWIR